jgi:hypothetical protein
MIPVWGPPPSLLKARSPRLLEEDSKAGILFIFEIFIFLSLFYR